MWVVLDQPAGRLVLRPPSGPKVMSFAGSEPVDVDDELGAWLIGLRDGGLFAETTDPSIVQTIEEVAVEGAVSEFDSPNSHGFVGLRSDRTCLWQVADGSKCGKSPEIHLGFETPETPEAAASSAISVDDLTAGGRKAGDTGKVSATRQKRQSK